ncbi:MAG: DUF3093 domain-containing protein [Antricoccus sp.]
MSGATAENPVRGYRERLSTAWWIWLVVLGMAVVLGAEVSSALPTIIAWPIYAIPLVLTIAGMAAINMGQVQIRDGVIEAGGNQLDIREVAAVEELDPTNTARTLGPDGDPTAWAFTRPWIHTSVKILTTTDDPPYFLISTRQPQILAAALIAAAAQAAD